MGIESGKPLEENDDLHHQRFLEVLEVEKLTPDGRSAQQETSGETAEPAFTDSEDSGDDDGQSAIEVRRTDENRPDGVRKQDLDDGVPPGQNLETFIAGGETSAELEPPSDQVETDISKTTIEEIEPPEELEADPPEAQSMAGKVTGGERPEEFDDAEVPDTSHDDSGRPARLELGTTSHVPEPVDELPNESSVESEGSDSNRSDESRGSIKETSMESDPGQERRVESFAGEAVSESETEPIAEKSEAPANEAPGELDGDVEELGETGDEITGDPKQAPEKDAKAEPKPAPKPTKKANKEPGASEASEDTVEQPGQPAEMTETEKLEQLKVALKCGLQLIYIARAERAQAIDLDVPHTFLSEGIGIGAASNPVVGIICRGVEVIATSVGAEPFTAKVLAVGTKFFLEPLLSDFRTRIDSMRSEVFHFIRVVEVCYHHQAGIDFASNPAVDSLLSQLASRDIEAAIDRFADAVRDQLSRSNIDAPPDLDVRPQRTDHRLHFEPPRSPEWPSQPGVAGEPMGPRRKEAEGTGEGLSPVIPSEVAALPPDFFEKFTAAFDEYLGRPEIVQALNANEPVEKATDQGNSTGPAAGGTATDKPKPNEAPEHHEGAERVQGGWGDGEPRANLDLSFGDEAASWSRPRGLVTIATVAGAGLACVLGWLAWRSRRN